MEQFMQAETGEILQLSQLTTITSVSTEPHIYSSTEQDMLQERMSQMQQRRCTFREACSAAETPAALSM